MSDPTVLPSGVGGDTLFWVEIGTLIHLIAFLMVFWHCMLRRREATSALLWMAVAWTLPILGPLIFLAFGINRVPQKAWRKQRSDDEFKRSRTEREEAPMPMAYWRATRQMLGHEAGSDFSRELNRTLDAALSDYPLLGGNRIEPFGGGDAAYPRMIEAIRSARHHIHLQTFILGGDETGRQFLDELRRRAEAGVTVRLLYDRFGSTLAMLRGYFRRHRRVPNFHLVGWTQANPIRRQFQVNLRNHRKLLIVDGHRAFTGGLNLASNNRSSPGRPADRDYHFEVRGPLVGQLQYTFLRDWYFMTDEDSEVLLSESHFPDPEAAGTMLARVVNGGPTSEIETLADTFFAAVVEARRQILVATPYLAPTPDLIRALRTAALGGMDVRLVVPRKNNHLYAGLAGQALYEELLHAGVRIFEREPPFMHAKAMVCDSEVSFIGTANLDIRSLRLNYETNVAVFDPVFADSVKALILEDIACSREITFDLWRRRPAYRRVLENFCSLLTPVL